MKYTIQDLSLFVLGIFIMNSCHKQASKEEEQNYTINGYTITLSEHSNIRTKLKMETLKSERLNSDLTTVRVVRAIPTGYAEIAPPFAGRIIKSFIKLGQKVEVSSPVFFH